MKYGAIDSAAVEEKSSNDLLNADFTRSKQEW